MDLKKLEETEKQSLEEMQEDFRQNENENPIIDRYNTLNGEEQHLLLLWLHYNSFTYLGKRYNCSASWMSKKIKRIIAKITE